MRSNWKSRLGVCWDCLSAAVLSQSTFHISSSSEARLTNLAPSLALQQAYTWSNPPIWLSILASITRFRWPFGLKSFTPTHFALARPYLPSSIVPGPEITIKRFWRRRTACRSSVPLPRLTLIFARANLSSRGLTRSLIPYRPPLLQLELNLLSCS